MSQLRYNPTQSVYWANMILSWTRKHEAVPKLMWLLAGFGVDKVALGDIFSEYFHFPCQFSFHQLRHIN
jgi:hypothetical protein